jgi:hypothetical protein
MLQGVNRSAQKCQTCLTPNFLQGAKMRTAAMPKMSRPQIFIWGHSRCAIMPLVHHPRKGVSRVARKRQGGAAPTSLFGATTGVQKCQPVAAPKGRVNRRSQQCLSKSTFPNQLQGVIVKTQKCHCSFTPTSFIWSRHDHAAMPRGKRSKGRVSQCSQKCLTKTTLPNQLQGVNTITQKCQTNVAPTEFGPSALRRNAVSRSPNNQRPSHARRNAILQSPRN